ncbi:nucleoporin Nup186/Nup192/Nup205 [Cokeromyces recurvatus]|uniref:nucleoporin Nup186/Nup192/Nup205 n=1 Tax=Cokeromyces recurvatus TaxID=90255 RepID=UPI0022203D81|nr:nucleoporin Nup186/Nup192/Nup205 [Cokeromyces recurvatus]KAI7905167.1 nucleoporin Nup186/Nup192/Nup205 [Cokeromyces recurvatus]
MTTLTVQLRALLNQVCEQRVSTSTGSAINLQETLNDKKELVAKLLDNPPKINEHRNSIKAGKAFINGKEFKINEDFIKEAIFLSDQLNIEEYEASRLLLEGISRASTMNLAVLDAAVYLYHEERGYILSILNIILESAKDQKLDPKIQSVFTQFMANIIKEQPSSNSFVSKILKSIKDIAGMISSLSKTGSLPVTPSSTNTTANSSQQQQQTTSLFQSFQKPQLQQQQQQQQQTSLPNNEPKLDSRTTTLRIDRLIDERIHLVQILYHVVSLYFLPEDDLISLLKHIQSINLSDATCPYLLTALLAALSVKSKELPENNFTKNEAYLKKINEQILNKSWKVNSLQVSAQIQWALSISILTKINSSTKITVPLEQSAIINVVESVMKQGVFGFMNSYLLYFKQTNMDKDKKPTIQNADIDDSAMAIDGLIVDPNDYTKFDVGIYSDFQKYVIYELENLAELFIFNMSNVFSNLKNLTSDELAQVSGVVDGSHRNGLEQFLTLLASIYRNRLNSGLKYWDHSNSLSTFVAWLLDFKLPYALAATFDFLGSISTGEKCALYAHNTLKIGISVLDISSSHLFSWGKLFSALQIYSQQYAKRLPEEEPPTIPPSEEEALCKFLYLCQQVVQYSQEARTAIWSDPVLRAHDSIVSMISCPTSSRFRSALYNLLAAFCSNWGGGINHIGEKISLEVWNTLENSDMVIVNKIMTQALPAATESTSNTPFHNVLFGNSTMSNYGQQLPVQPSAENPDSVEKSVKKISSSYLPEQPGGFLREFQDEKNRKLYTETLSFLNLMASLIHTQSKRDQLVTGFAVTSSSIPFCLGGAYRSPGTAPYISLVVDHIFLNLKNLQYIHPETRWQLTEVCLKVIENSIMALNFEPIYSFVKNLSQTEMNLIANYTQNLKNSTTVTADESLSSSKTIYEDFQNSLLSCVSHPGYDILVRILSGGALVQELFKIILMVKENTFGSDKSKTGKDIYFKKSIVRCLRIFNRVFNIQNMFVNFFIPQLEQTYTILPMGEFKLGNYTFPLPPPTLRSLSSLMLYNTEVIVQIASMVNHEDFENICHLCISILSALASDPKGNDLIDEVKFPHHLKQPMGGIGSQLSGILFSSDRATELIQGFADQLEIETAEITTYDDYEYNINVIPFWLAEKTLSNIHRYNDYEEYQYPSSIRINLLDLLLKSVNQETPSPTIAEFLLGYDLKDVELKGFYQKSLTTYKQSRLACFTALLSMMSKGINDDDEQPLIATHPVLAEKCYQLIYKLCVREPTSAVTLNYLHSSNNFLLEQFKLISSRFERSLTVTEPCFEGILICADKTQIKTDYLTLVSVLHQRAWLIELIALELHLSAQAFDKLGSNHLLRALYGGNDSTEFLVEKFESLHVEPNDNYHQPIWNILEIINSLDFIWVDGLDAAEEDAKNLTYFKDFDAKKYVIKKDGHELYDIRTIYRILRQYQISNKKIANMSDQDYTALEIEMGYLLKKLMAENRHREIANGRLHCLRAWKKVVEVTLTDCFDAFSFESRERIIYDLLTVLLPKLDSDACIDNNILKGLSDMILSLLTRLKEDKSRQAILHVSPKERTTTRRIGLPDDKLYVIISLIIECIRKKNSIIQVRSIMYTALVSLLQYIVPYDEKNEEDYLNDRIRSRIIDIIYGSALNIICDDACHSVNEYKASAFALLEALYNLFYQSKDTSMHTHLVKNNFLKYIIDMTERSDADLLYILRNRDGK